MGSRSILHEFILSWATLPYFTIYLCEVKNCTFRLIVGYANHTYTIILDNSKCKEMKLGVLIVVHHEERVLEGISNMFKVHEAKTGSKGGPGQPC